MITNIGPAHLEFLGTIENVARAKAELIDGAAAGRVAVVPDEPLLEPYLTRTDITVQARRPERAAPVRDRATRRRTSCRTRALQSPLRSVLGVPLPETALNVEFSKLREEERRAAGWRSAAERLLQREPRLDARGPRASRRPRR